MKKKEQIEHNRVALHTPDEINKRIRRHIEQSVLFCAQNPEGIKGRLVELQEEWDIQRMLETGASVLGLLGFVAAFTGRRTWLLLPLIVLGFLFQHAIQGWYPPVSLLRRMGVRTMDEILRERYALRALRGDFENVGSPNRDTPPDQRARQIIAVINE